MTAYPGDRLYEELSFLSYHVSWSLEELLDLPHAERARWCRSISAINERLNDEAEAR